MLRRWATPAAAAVLIAGLSACGGDDEPEAAAPVVTTAPTSTTEATPATTTLKPVAYADPFLGARAAAAHMPDTAAALAAGFATSAKATGSDTAAAELGGQLQHLLTEYVFLSMLAMEIELVKPDDPANADAIAQVDKNAVALADTIGKVATSAQRSEFLTGWRKQAKAMIDSAISNDSTVDDPASEVLADYPKQAATLLGKISDGELDTTKFATALGEQLDGLSAAQRSVKNKEDVGFRNLYRVADGMSTVAGTLTEALAEGGDLAGDPKSVGATARAKLSHLLTAHVYLATTAVLVEYSPLGVLEVQSGSSVASALGGNSTDITDAIGALAPDFRAPFDQSWAVHVNDILDYGKAAKAKDSAAQTRDLASLESYRTAAGKLLAEASEGGLKAAAVAKAFETHIESLIGTVDALAERMID